MYSPIKYYCVSLHVPRGQEMFEGAEMDDDNGFHLAFEVDRRK